MSRGSTSGRIALCSEYSLADRGGVSVLVEELILGLGNEFELWLVTPDSSEAVASHPAASHLAGHVSFQLGALPPSPRFKDEAARLADRLRSEQIRLAHFHCGGIFGWGNRWPGPSIPEVCSREGMKVMWTNHSTEPPSRAFIAPRRPRWLSNLLAPVARRGKIRQIRAIDAEIAVSGHNRHFVESHYPSGKALHRIYHSRLDEALAVERGRQRQTILSVGHMTFRKGHDTLAGAFLKVAAGLPGWTLEFIGHDGGDGCWQAIEAMCAKHPEGSRVRLLGVHSKPGELMAEASIFVQPSREEALGLALQEAIFLGCPAIGSRVGGIPEVIDEGETGLLVPPDDVDALSEALVTLIADESLRAKMSSQGRSSIIAKGMTRRQMLDAHRSLYLAHLS